MSVSEEETKVLQNKCATEVGKVLDKYNMQLEAVITVPVRVIRVVPKAVDKQKKKS